MYQNDYVRYGFSNSGTVLLTSDISTENYTTVGQKYESEYLYTYILELYKKFLLKKLNTDFNKTKDFKEVESGFLNFTKKLWIQEITNDDTGTLLYNYWKEVLELEELYSEVKNKYDIIYKEWNIEKNTKITILIAIMLFISLIFNIMNLLM